jgi:hypothetical protein
MYQLSSLSIKYSRITWLMLTKVIKYSHHKVNVFPSSLHFTRSRSKHLLFRCVMMSIKKFSTVFVRFEKKNSWIYSIMSMSLWWKWETFRGANFMPFSEKWTRQWVSGNKQCSHSTNSSRECYCCHQNFKRLKIALIASINVSVNGSFVNVFYGPFRSLEKRENENSKTRSNRHGWNILSRPKF